MEHFKEDDLLQLIHDLTAELINARAEAGHYLQKLRNAQRTEREITHALDEINAPQIHIVNRVEWALDQLHNAPKS